MLIKLLNAAKELVKKSESFVVPCLRWLHLVVKRCETFPNDDISLEYNQKAFPFQLSYPAKAISVLSVN